MGLLLLSLLACKGDTTDSGVDSATDSGAAEDSAEPVAVELLSISVSCADGVQAELLSAGWLSSATLTLYGPNTESGWLWEESHPFPTLPSEYDPDGAWDRYALSLTPVEADYVAGSSTAADCEAELSWAVQVVGSESGETDCVAGGDRPDAIGCRSLVE